MCRVGGLAARAENMVSVDIYGNRLTLVVRFIWRATIHQPPCAPGGHAAVIGTLNEYAAARMRAIGVATWEAPAELSASAPAEWFGAGPHSGQCNQALTDQGELYDCQKMRLQGRSWRDAGVPHGSPPGNPWARAGGLSRAITATLLPLVADAGCRGDTKSVGPDDTSAD